MNAKTFVKYLENKQKYGSKTMSSSSSFIKALVEIEKEMVCYKL